MFSIYDWLGWLHSFTWMCHLPSKRFAAYCICSQIALVFLVGVWSLLFCVSSAIAVVFLFLAFCCFSVFRSRCFLRSFPYLFALLAMFPFVFADGYVFVYIYPCLRLREMLWAQGGELKWMPSPLARGQHVVYE